VCSSDLLIYLTCRMSAVRYHGAHIIRIIRSQ
jgi:hypothetical protein